MKILLTGATGYIAKRLLPVLVQDGYAVVCCIRDKKRFHVPPPLRDNVETIEVDFLKPETLQAVPEDIDGAFYLIHSMASGEAFDTMEREAAINFRKALRLTKVQHVVYLSGIVNERNLSKHLSSRLAVEEELSQGDYDFTTLRAGIVIGSGSASFEIIRDLVEKLPVMITPKWLNTQCQPISVRDVIDCLRYSMLNKKAVGIFDVGGPDILTYREMLLGYARVRGLKRWIWTVPVMTPKLSSYWLYFITATSFKLASALVDSMKVKVVCRDNRLIELLNLKPLTYEQSLHKAFTALDSNEIVSSWKDALVSGRLNESLSSFIQVPAEGCLVDQRTAVLHNREKCLDKIWRIGGNQGWYFANTLWRIRGVIDKLTGGVGLRRGRTNPYRISAGDVIDFWRVLYADRSEGRLLLFAEMKLPGEAWLEFKVSNTEIKQTATFRPKGIWGRMYWYGIYPLHAVVFRGMIKALAAS